MADPSHGIYTLNVSVHSRWADGFFRALQARRSRKKDKLETEKGKRSKDQKAVDRLNPVRLIRVRFNSAFWWIAPSRPSSFGRVQRRFKLNSDGRTRAVPIQSKSTPSDPPPIPIEPFRSIGRPPRRNWGSKIPQIRLQTHPFTPISNPTDRPSATGALISCIASSIGLGHQSSTRSSSTRPAACSGGGCQH